MNDQIIQHYNQQSSLKANIENHIVSSGRSLNEISTKDLATIDEFHIRGRQATLELATILKLKPNDHILDIGCGLGGPARTIAEKRGCTVRAVDVTPEFIEAAIAITKWVNLTSKVEFTIGDATDLPYDDHQFDAAISIHTGMNIADKKRYYSEALRVIKPGHCFGIYDVLKGQGGDVIYPVPWARDQSLSYLLTCGELTKHLEEVGFKIQAVVDTTKESAAWLQSKVEFIRKHGPNPLSFELFLGQDFTIMMANLAQNLLDGRVRTVTCIARSPKS